MNQNTVTTGEVRFSYTNLFKPRAQQEGADPKYSTTILVLSLIHIFCRSKNNTSPGPCDLAHEVVKSNSKGCKFW